MNILIVSPNVVVGGAQKMLVYLAKGLAERGHEIVIFTTHVDLAKLPPFSARFKYVVVDVPILKFGGELSNYTSIESVWLLLFRLLKLRWALRKAIREYRIELVNPHNPPANWLCAFLGVPVIWSCLNRPMAFYRPIRGGYTPLWPSKGRLHHWVMELLYEIVDFVLIRFGIDSIVTPSEKISRMVRNVYGRDSEAIVFALSPDDGTWQRVESAAAKFLGIEASDFVLLQVGQLTDDKRPLFSLDVLERVARKVPRTRLLFVGDGALRPVLEAEVKRRGLEDQVAILGFRNEVELADIYGRAHVLLFPGVDQPWGIVPLEAIWNWVVPVVAESAGITDLLVRHCVTTVAAPNPDAFARHVLWVYEHAEEIPEWLERIGRSLAEELSFDAYIAKHEAHFRRVCGTRRSRSTSPSCSRNVETAVGKSNNSRSEVNK